MIFNSFSYLIFFPVVTLLYFVLPRKIRWVWLLVSSYYFYMNWHAEYALLMAASTLVTYICALAVSRIAKPKARKAVLVGGIVFNLGMLGYFKYTGMFIDVLNRVCGALGFALRLPQVDILLPVGISFFTFQALGYMIDVYKGRTKAETNLFRYALFISFFPQLVAGPIERSNRLLRQLAEPHDFDFRRARDGLLIMLLGFFEKVVIADRAAIYVNAIFGNWVESSGAQIALATAVFAVQDLCDFAGYSYIAIGTAKVLGVELMTNFRQPYFAHSVTNFWGMLNGALQVVEGILPQKRPKRLIKLHHVANVLWTDFLILITMLIFRATSMSAALGMLWRIPTAWRAPALATGFSGMQALCLGVCMAILFAIELLHEKRKTLTQLTDRLPLLARGALYVLAILAIAVFGIWGPGYSAQAFIYFQF